MTPSCEFCPGHNARHEELCPRHKPANDADRREWKEGYTDGKIGMRAQQQGALYLMGYRKGGEQFAEDHADSLRSQQRRIP